MYSETDVDDNENLRVNKIITNRKNINDFLVNFYTSVMTWSRDQAT